MPMIDVTMLKGALTAQQRTELTEKLTSELLRIEGVDNEASRSIAWVLFHEVEPDSWAVGGKFDDSYVPEGGRFLTVVSVPSGGLHAKGKKDDIARSVHDAFREVLQLPPETGARWAPWVIVNDIPDGNWGAGGSIRHLFEIHSYARSGVAALPQIA
ncbi:tautomerase family protein [Nocardia noduli]|uniref:tautomerase family protein n=1 Tax=Nocardia noduli TaxID=2815722 RepID=UPI001C21959B|nr:tautomerase family protein [Nocardia noduli]